MRVPRGGIVAFAVAVLVLMGGCSGGGDQAGSGSQPDEPLKGDGAGFTSSNFFTSPSDNIACAIWTGGARCDIGERAWQPTPKPDSCEYDWGPALVIGRTGSGNFGCVSDTVRSGDSTVLPYGASTRRGPFRCYSKRTGVTCRNLDTGHGFTLSRESYDLF